MASQVEDNLHCPTCLDIFKDPVILPCCHSFCRACVQQLEKEEGYRRCPVCRLKFSSMDANINFALRNVCEVFLHTSVKSEDICSVHKETLKLFCLDDEELVCFICRDAEIHADHKFRPLDEVVKDYKLELHNGLQDAKGRLAYYEWIKDRCSEHAAYVKVQSSQVESKIKKDFEELRRFLQVEEEARLCAVREEEQEKSRLLKEKIEALDRDMAALSEVIRTTEEQLTSDPISLVKNFQTTMNRTQELPDKPELLSGALLDEAKHVGNLKFTVWERMKEMVSCSPVILDPNTAHSELHLSDDLTSVSFKGGQHRPETAERSAAFDVLGSALTKGKHMWDVEVGDNTDWKVGVAWLDPSCPDIVRTWRIRCLDDKFAILAEPLGSWKPPVKLQRIRIQVDFDKRSLSFSESLTKTELGNITRSAWPNWSHMKMFPFIFTMDKSPLKIIPLQLCVTTRSQ
ncbi:E3 ubiquitin-protein ligase TRIM35-like [Festucalex cinctus]